MLGSGVIPYKIKQTTQLLLMVVYVTNQLIYKSMNNFLKNVIKWDYIAFRVLFISCFMFAASNVEANISSDLLSALQTESVTIKMRNSTIAEILIEVKKQTGIGYYVSEQINVELSNLNVDVKDESVKTLLEKVLTDKGYRYVIANNAITIVKNLNPQPEEASTEQQPVVIEIKGKVVDEKGDPITGATVISATTSTGTVTDEFGMFTLTLTRRESVEVSCVGYESQNIDIARSNLNLIITMKIDEIDVDEVVVTGYGTVKKESFTGTSTTVTGEELLRVSQTNVLSALAVFDPSLQIVTNNVMGSDPNTLPEMYVRGQTSVSSTQNSDVLGSTSEYALTTNANLPIFILDGHEVAMTVIYDMDPTRIKSMTILKDAASTAIYGSRASNGVIVVETVAPKKGRLNVSYSLTGTINAPDLTNYNILNAEEKLAVEIAAGLTQNSENLESDYFDGYDTRMEHYRRVTSAINQGVDTYWLSYPVQVGLNQKHSVTLDGGTDAMRFSLNLNYSTNNGVMKGSYRDTYGASFNLNYKVSDKLRITNQMSFAYNKSEDSPYGSFDDYYTMQPYWAPYDIATGALTRSFDTPGSLGTPNPLYVASLGSYDYSGYFSITNNFNVDYYITNDLRFTTSFSASFTNNSGEVFTDPDHPDYDNYIISEKGRLVVNDTESVNWNLNSILQYNKYINNHSINARLGINIRENYNASATSTYKGFISSALVSEMFASELSYDPVLSDNKSRLAGYFLALNYTYNNIYLFDLSVRMDGSSEFGNNNKYAPFWSFGTGLNIHNYEYFKSVEAINMLRVTANYGQTGQVNFAPYMAQNTYQLSSDWAMTGIGATLIARGNQDLAWEVTDSFNVSAETSLLDSRLSLGLSYYNRTTSDLVSDSTIPLSTGFTSYKDNVGKIRNEGFEFNASYAIIKAKDMGLTVGVNGARNIGTLLELSDSQKAYNDLVVDYYEGLDYYGRFTDNYPIILRYEEGGSLSSIYGVQSLGISPTTGEELFLTPTGAVTTEWSSRDQVIIGNSAPTLSGSMQVSLFYKKFSLFTTFMYSMGADTYNSTLANLVEGVGLFETNVDDRVLNGRWQEVGDVAQYSALILDKFYVQPTSRFLQRENYLKFNSLSLSYTLTSDWLKKAGITMCRLSLSTNDVFTLSTVQQERGTTYPFARTYNFTVNVSF